MGSSGSFPGVRKPATVKIGQGRIYGITAGLGWRPVRTVNLEASLFLNESELVKPAPEFAGGEEASLPNIAKVGARGAVTIDASLTRTVDSQCRRSFPMSASLTSG